MKGRAAGLTGRPLLAGWKSNPKAMNTKFLKLLSTLACVLALSSSVLLADEEKKKECPCEKEKPKA